MMPPPKTPKARKKIIDTASSEAESPKGLSELVTELSIKSKLDEFRLFFDLKPGPWDKLRTQLNTHVLTNYSWISLRDNENLRRTCASEFFEECAIKYWGEETREKTLIEGRIDGGEDSGCRYPEDKRPMINVLMMLLEKSAKSKRPSTTQDVSGTRLNDYMDTGSPAGSVTGNKRAEQTLDYDEPVSPLPMVSVELLKELRIPQEDTPGGLFGSGRLISGGYLASPRASTEVPVSRPSMMGMSPQRPLALSGNGNAPVSLRQKDDNPTTDVAQRQKILTGSNLLATYFLVTSSVIDNPEEPVCIPFTFYHDADEFLNQMEEHVGDAVSSQLYNDMPYLNRCYAVVHLNWSGVSFVIRRGKEDLHALENRVICAWNAKDEGGLNMIEFEIGVTLKPDR